MMIRLSGPQISTFAPQISQISRTINKHIIFAVGCRYKVNRVASRYPFSSQSKYSFESVIKGSLSLLRPTLEVHAWQSAKPFNDTSY